MVVSHPFEWFNSIDSLTTGDTKMATDTRQESLPLFDPIDAADMVVVLHDLESMTYKLSDMGQAIFFEILRKLDSRENYEDQRISVTAKEMEFQYHAFSKPTIYRNFAKACTEVRLMLIYRVSKGVENGKEVTILDNLNVFDKGRIVLASEDGEKPRKATRAEFRIHSDVAPYLTEITKDHRFNTFLIQQTQNLKMSAAARLYQWLRRYHYLKKIAETTYVKITVPEIRYKLAFSVEKEPPEWRFFNRDVLKPAVASVNKSTDLYVEYKVVGKGFGGKAEVLEFAIRDKGVIDGECFQDGEYIDGKAPQLSDELRAALYNLLPDLNDKAMAALSVQHEDVIRAAMAAYAKAKNVKKPTAYLLKLAEEMAKEHPATGQGGSSARGHKSTYEKLTDRSWAEGLDDLFKDWDAE